MFAIQKACVNRRMDACHYFLCCFLLVMLNVRVYAGVRSLGCFNLARTMLAAAILSLVRRQGRSSFSAVLPLFRVKTGITAAHDERFRATALRATLRKTRRGSATVSLLLAVLLFFLFANLVLCVLPVHSHIFYVFVACTGERLADPF